jgi:hypothetical protein
MENEKTELTCLVLERVREIEELVINSSERGIIKWIKEEASGIEDVTFFINGELKGFKILTDYNGPTIWIDTYDEYVIGVSSEYRIERSYRDDNHNLSRAIESNFSEVIKRMIIKMHPFNTIKKIN